MSEDNQSARECIVEVLQIIDTVITTVFITAKVRTEILPEAVAVSSLVLSVASSGSCSNFARGQSTL